MLPACASAVQRVLSTHVHQVALKLYRISCLTTQFDYRLVIRVHILRAVIGRKNVIKSVISHNNTHTIEDKSYMKVQVSGSSKCKENFSDFYIICIETAKKLLLKTVVGKIFAM